MSSADAGTVAPDRSDGGGGGRSPGNSGERTTEAASGPTPTLDARKPAGEGSPEAGGPSTSSADKRPGLGRETRPLALAVCLVVGLITWFIPTPSGLEPAAWHLFAIFLATIVGIIGKAAPMGALSVIAMALCAATGVVAPDGDAGDRISQALSGFSNSTIWLIVSAFFAARAVPPWSRS